MTAASTRLADISEKNHSKDLGSNKGIVKFYTYLNPRVLCVESVYKDRELSQFNMTDVIKAQAQKAGVVADYECIIQKNVVSHKALRFFQNNQFKDGDEMTEDELLEFLTSNPNGVSSQHIAHTIDKNIYCGTVLRQDDPCVDPEQATVRDSSFSVVLELESR